MADVSNKYVNLEGLRRQACELASAVQSLAALFEEGATLLHREDQVAHLKTLRSKVLEKIERVKALESSASSGYSVASTAGSLLRLGAGLIAMTQENKTMQAISRELLTRPDKEPPFGTVFACIGHGGIPEDIGVVNISGTARESKENERVVMDRLFTQGNLLFTGDAFSRLIDRIAAQILKGKLSLPIPVERLAEYLTSSQLKLVPEKRQHTLPKQSQ